MGKHEPSDASRSSKKEPHIPVTWDLRKDTRQYLLRLALSYAKGSSPDIIRDLVDKTIDQEFPIDELHPEGWLVDEFYKVNARRRLKQRITRHEAKAEKIFEYEDDLHGDVSDVREGFASPDKEASKNALWEIVAATLKQNPRDTFIVVRHLVHEQTFKEIAAELGITQQRVNKLYQGALRRLQSSQKLLEFIKNN